MKPLFLEKNGVNQLDIDAVILLWPIGRLRGCKLLAAGKNNESFHVQTENGDFVLRRSRDDKTFEELAFEHELIKHLNQDGFPVPEIILSCSGLTWEVYGGRLWTVSRFVHGNHLLRNPQSARLGGAMLAKFHNSIEKFSPKTPVPPVQDRMAQVLEMLLACKQIVASDSPLFLLLERTRRITDKTRLALNADANDLPQTVIHGSCRLTSLLIRDNTVVALLDMDSARKGAHAEDIAIALASFAKCREGDAAADKIMLTNFLAAYSDIHPIDKAEVEAIPAHLAQALLFPWAKTIERSLMTAYVDEASLRKAQWRLSSAEHAINWPGQLTALLKIR